MTTAEQAYGSLNPNAPPELARFPSSVGQWQCAVRLKRDDGAWANFRAEWTGRYILDGYAIEDEYRMMTAAGDRLVLGTNLRAFDRKTNSWHMKWLDGLAGHGQTLAPRSSVG